MPAPVKRANSGSATVDEQGNVGQGSGKSGGMKRTNSDLLQQSQLSFAAKKAVPVPSPVKAKTGPAISASTAPLLEATAACKSSTSLAPAASAPVLGAGKETDEMVRNLEMGLYPGDEGLESDASGDEDEEEEETLVTPKKKARVGAGRKRGAAAAADEEDDEEDRAIAVHTGEDGVDEENALVARGLGSPNKTFNHGSKYRTSMLAATEAVERVRAQATAAAASGAASGPKGAKKNGRKSTEAQQEAGTVALADKLNVKDKKWEGIYWDTHKTMGGDETPPIHCTPKSHTRIHHILRVFDLTSEYGPCVGLTRLQRWERANEWGLNPPKEIKEILLTLEGANEDAYRETVFHGHRHLQRYGLRGRDSKHIKHF